MQGKTRVAIAATLAALAAAPSAAARPTDVNIVNSVLPVYIDQTLQVATPQRFSEDFHINVGVEGSCSEAQFPFLPAAPVSLEMVHVTWDTGTTLAHKPRAQFRAVNPTGVATPAPVGIPMTASAYLDSAAGSQALGGILVVGDETPASNAPPNKVEICLHPGNSTDPTPGAWVSLTGTQLVG